MSFPPAHFGRLRSEVQSTLDLIGRLARWCSVLPERQPNAGTVPARNLRAPQFKVALDVFGGGNRPRGIHLEP